HRRRAAARIVSINRRMSMPQKEQFQIPQEMRHLAEENVERARQLYLNFMDSVEQAMAVWSAPNSGAITPGFSEVRDRAASFAKETANAAFKLAKDVTRLMTSRNCSTYKLVMFN